MVGYYCWVDSIDSTIDGHRHFDYCYCHHHHFDWIFYFHCHRYYCLHCHHYYFLHHCHHHRVLNYRFDCHFLHTHPRCAVASNFDSCLNWHMGIVYLAMVRSGAWNRVTVVVCILVVAEAIATDPTQRCLSLHLVVKCHKVPSVMLSMNGELTWIHVWTKPIANQNPIQQNGHRTRVPV